MSVELCPITGLEIRRNPAWIGIELDKNYLVDYYFIGKNIMVAVAKGFATAKGVKIAKALEEHLIRENLEPGRKNIYVIDIQQLGGIDMDGREEHRKMIQGLRAFHAVIYAGGSRILQMSINLARKVHLVPLVTDVMLDYRSALEKACWTLIGQELRFSMEELKAGVKPDSKGFTLKSNSCVIQSTWFGDRIHFVHVTGSLDQDLNAVYNRTFEEQLEERQRGKPRGIYYIQDLGSLDTVSFQARRQFIDFLRTLHPRYPLLEVLSSNASPSLQATINLSKLLVPFPAEIVHGHRELCKHLDQFVERHYGPKGKPKPNKVAKSKTANEQLIDFIGGTRWDVPGAMEIPVKESDPIRPIYDAFALIKRDLDEVIQGQLHLEEELRRMAKEAQAATKAKSQFLATMSHEIRTPLNGVIGMTELLLDSGLSHDQKGYAETIKGSGEHLMALINDILDLSKIEAGKLEIEKIVFNLGKVLSTCSDAWVFAAREKGIDFITSKPIDMPKFVVGDPGRLRQILMNLVGNALKFTTKGLVSLSVEVVAKSESANLFRFAVRDTGIGIPKDRQHLLFQSFRQIDSSMARKYGGSGLGLAITNQLVELLGGEVGFNSEEGVGSEFWFTMPLGIASAEASAASSEAKINAHHSSLEPEKGVLVVEDNHVNQKVVLGMLRTLGVIADLASDGMQAIEKLKQSRYGLIFMDCQMPGMDGFEATRTIRNGGAGDFARTTKIVAMTANAMMGDRERCIEAGMDDYISKPLTRKSLQAMLEKCLELG